MAQTIQLKRSATAGNKPTSSDLALGEIAINTADGAVYIKKGNNDIVAVADNDILHIDTSNSRVGIGTTNPNTTLTVDGDVRIKDSIASLYLQDSDGSNQVLEIKQSAGASTLSARNGTSNGSIRFTGFNGTSSTEYARFDSSGNFGIGTTSPNKPLDVVGDIRAKDSSDNQHQLRADKVISYGTDAILQAQSAGDDVRLNTEGNVTRLIATAEGHVGIGTTSPDFGLHVKHATTNVTARFESGDNQVWIDLHDDGSGNYGALLGHDSDAGTLFMVADASVSTKFAINNSGAVTFNGAYTFPTADGSANQVLQTDGSGNLSFATVSGGGGVTISNNTNNRVLTGDGTNANAEANLTFDGSTLDVTGNLIIDTNPASTYGVHEALRIDDNGSNNDRQLQFFELLNSGSRSHRIAYNTNITSTGSAYVHTQGNYGGSSQIEFGNSGAMIFYVNAQGTGGSTEAITPTERFRIESTGDVQFRNTSGTTAISFQTGSNGHFKFIDSSRARFGNSNDMDIYHDGSNSYVRDVGTGELYIDTNSSVRLISDGSYANGKMAEFTKDGDVKLYYDNSEKLATTSSGVTVTGSLVADTIDVGGDLTLDADGGDVILKDGGTEFGRLSNVLGGLTLRSGSSSANGIIFDTSGNIILGGNITGGTGISTGGRIKTTDGLFQADEGNQKFRQYEIGSSTGTETFLLGKIENGGNADGGVTGTVKAAYDYGDTVNNCNIHFTFAQRSGVARGHWWYENTDDDASTDVVSVRLVDDGAGGMFVWLYVGDYVHCFVEAVWRQCSSVTDSGTLSAGTITTGTTLFDTANDPTSEHHIGRLYAHDHIFLPDNKVAYFGTGNDLQIWHSSTNSLIDHTGTGDLYIRNTSDDKDIILQSDDGNGGLTEYIRLDGSSTETTLSRTTKVIDNFYLGVGAGPDLYLMHDGSNSHIRNNTGNLTIQNNTDDGDIIIRTDDGAGGTTTYMTFDGSNERIIISKSVTHSDNVRGRYGASNDLQIYHNGTDSYIENATGNIEIRNNADDGDINFRSDNGSGGLTTYFAIDGGGEYNRFYKDAYFTDNVKALFGSSSDLQIYHDGSNSYITEGGTGDLLIQSNNSIRLRATSGENIIQGIADGAVTLYYDNSAKLATKSDGVDITGELQSDSLDVDGAADISGNLTIGGNLTVNGTTVTNSATNTTIEDALIELGSGNTGANSNDLGLILERGTTGDNIFMGWDESSNRVRFATTTATGASTGDLTLTNTNIQAGRLYGNVTGDVTGNVTGDVTGNADTATTAGTVTTAAQPNITSLGTLTSLNVDDITIDGSTISDSSDLTVDVGGDIILDADGGDIILKDNGVQFAKFTQLIGSLAIGAGTGTDIPMMISSTKTLFFKDVQLGDDEKLIFGDGEFGNMQLFHDGTDSFIDDMAEGNLVLRTNGTSVKMMTGSENMVVATKDGSVDLYYDNSKKLETTSSGVTVTGNIAVTGTVDGRDIATDGSKLDGIEANATADQTASEILTAIKTVDGSGSGLDADVLQGQGPSYYRNASNLNSGTVATSRLPAAAITYQQATDDRDMKPNTSGIQGSIKAIKPFFSSYGGMTGSANSTYVDVLVLDTYSDSSGGGPNAITFKKGNSAGNPEMHIWKGAWGGTTWGTGQRVFADNYHPNADTLTTARTIAGTSFDGSANIDISYNNLTNKPTIPTNNNQLTNGAGYLTSSSNLNASNLSSGTIPSARFPDNIFDSYRHLTLDSSTEDFNDATTTGTYHVSNWSESGDTVANGPTGSYAWGMLRVTNWMNTAGSGDGYVLQEYFPHNTDTCWTRIQWNSSWGGWRESWGSGSDGSGSGLDADLLDGVQGASYLRSDANDDFSGTLNYTPDTGDVLNFDGQSVIRRISANGGLAIGHDDALILTAGEAGTPLRNSSNVSPATETIFMGAEGGVIMYAFPNNDVTWSNRRTFSFDGTNGINLNSNFTVDNNGNLSATTKSFDIPHPSKEGMRLRHGVLEGPENGVYVRGKSKEKVILLPDYWPDLIHEDSITVQLTAIGGGQELYVEKIEDNKVYVNGDNYFYYIQAERKDVERFEVEYEV